MAREDAEGQCFRGQTPFAGRSPICSSGADDRLWSRVDNFSSAISRLRVT